MYVVDLRHFRQLYHFSPQPLHLEGIVLGNKEAGDAVSLSCLPCNNELALLNLHVNHYASNFPFRSYSDKAVMRLEHNQGSQNWLLSDSG